MENMNDKESEKSASVSRRQFLAYTLNAMATDSSVDWEADAELV